MQTTITTTTPAHPLVVIIADAEHDGEQWHAHAEVCPVLYVATICVHQPDAPVLVTSPAAYLVNGDIRLTDAPNGPMFEFIAAANADLGELIGWAKAEAIARATSDGEAEAEEMPERQVQQD